MKETDLDRKTTSAILSGIFVATLFGVGLVALSAVAYAEYGFVLFVITPFLVGALAPIVAGFRAPLTKAMSVQTGMISLGFVALGLVLVRIEGIICIIMAAPLAAGIGYIGSIAGHGIQQSRRKNRAPIFFAFFLLIPPSLLTVEENLEQDREILPITTSIEINAPVGAVWDHVISFPDLPPPTELLFTSGIAYPLRARIEGSGVGAVRYCDFSTGSFVEPITAWEENRRLAFSVEEQPIPMKELSPYADIDPAHLHGYFVSTRGEFRLIDLGNGRTRLEGTTWYYQKLRPGFYWNLWTDYIIHTIHRRVLRHIKHEAEKIPHPTRQ